MKKKIWEYTKCEIAFHRGLPCGIKICPYCKGELKLHRVVDPLTCDLERKEAKQ